MIAFNFRYLKINLVNDTEVSVKTIIQITCKPIQSLTAGNYFLCRAC